MKLGIAGSRAFCDLGLVGDFIAGLKGVDAIVTGDARGVDRTVYLAATRCRIPVTMLAADWERFGKSAGVIRNKTLVEQSDFVVVFWDGRSPGSLDVIYQAAAKKKLAAVYTAPVAKDFSTRERKGASCRTESDSPQMALKF